jgi:hypothetical protein
MSKFTRTFSNPETEAQIVTNQGDMRARIGMSTVKTLAGLVTSGGIASGNPLAIVGGAVSYLASAAALALETHTRGDGRDRKSEKAYRQRFVSFLNPLKF